jgi:alpha/beta superfamily hydrolase
LGVGEEGDTELAEVWLIHLSQSSVLFLIAGWHFGGGFELKFSIFKEAVGIERTGMGGK